MKENAGSLFKRTLVVLSAILVFFLLLFFLYRLKSLISVFIITIILSYVISIISTYFERKIKRNISKIISVAIVILIIVLFFSVVIPPIVNETSNFIKNFSKITSDFTSYLMKLNEKIERFVGENKIFSKEIKDITDYINEKLPDIVREVSQRIFKFFTSLFQLFLSFILSLILSIFFIFDRERIISGVLSLFSDNAKKNIVSYSETLNFYLKRYIFVQGIMSISIGITLWIVASLLKIPYAGTLGFIGGVAEIVPYVGAIFTFSLGVILSLTVSPLTALWFSIFYIAQQQITSQFVYPILWAKAILKISPFSVLLTMLILASVFGVWGVLFTVPILIILKITFNYLRKERAFWKMKNI